MKSQMIFHGLQFSKQLLSIFLPPKSTWARCYLCRQELFALLLQEMNILRPGLGQGVTNQIKFSSSFPTLPMGRFMFIIHVTASQYLIALCCLIPKKHRHFFVVVVAVREHCLLVKEENTKTLDVFLQTSLHLKGFKAWLSFLRKALKTKEKGKSVTKGTNEPRGED